MKKINNINTIVVVALLFVILVVSGCSSDFLDKTPTGTYTADNFYISDAAVQSAVDPLYNRAWFGFHSQSNAMWAIGSLRGNDAYNAYNHGEFVHFQTTSLTGEVGDAWRSLYTVVSLSSSLITNIKNNCTADVTQKAKDEAIGTAYLMRATAYFFMVRTWGPVILYEDNYDIVKDPIRPLNPEEDVFKFIIRDLRKACELLPETNGNGRVSVYAAKAMLAKVLLAHSGWNKPTRDEGELAECVSLCEDVIDHSGASLMPKYEDLFKYQNNLNSESLYAMRWRVAPSYIWGSQNAMVSELSWGDVCDVGCWGHDLCATIDMINLYNLDPLNHDAIRRKATFFIPGEHYDYIHSATGGYTYPKASDNTGWMQVKKGVVGCKEDNDGNLSQQNSPLHTYILRLADVYLIHAEASLGNQAELTGGRGLESFNAIRKRAGVEQKDKITFLDIINERRLEFCCEYQTWFEMVSWFRWQPEYMLDYFNNHQYRGYLINSGGIRLNPDGSLSYHVAFFQIGGQDAWDTIEGYTDDGQHFTPTVVTKNNVFIPYPETDRLRNHYLSEDPVPYDFGDGSSE